jgi:hypothetical protein
MDRERSQAEKAQRYQAALKAIANFPYLRAGRQSLCCIAASAVFQQAMRGAANDRPHQ